MEGSLVAYKVFTNGSVLNASEMNEYLMNQSVITFSNSTARGSAITAPVEGMITYLEDTQTYESWDGAAWVAFGGGASSGNAIINGAFEINQRNFTSISSLTTELGFDRWKNVSAGDGTTTFSAQTFTAGSPPVEGYELAKFLRVATSGQTSTGARSSITQAIENVSSFAGQTATISFYAKAASGTPKIALELEQTFGTGGSTANQIALGQVAISTTMTRYSLTTTIPNLIGKTVGPNSRLLLGLFLSAGSDFNARTGSLGIQSNTFDIWGVQVEAGSTATPFKRNANSIQGELAACQRYYQRWSQASAFSGIGGLGFGLSTTNAETFFFPAVTLRVPPTSIDFANVAASDGTNRTNTTSVSLTGGNDSRVNVRLVTASGLTQYRPYTAETTSAGNGFIGLSAEL